MYKNRLITCIVILSLLYTNCVSALNKTSEFINPKFTGLIKPLALVSNLFEKKIPNIEDLLIIKSSLIEFLGFDYSEDITLVYNKRNKELFIYDDKHIIHISKAPGKDYADTIIGGLKIRRYGFNPAIAKRIKTAEGTIVVEPERKEEISPLPTRLESPLYLKARFLIGFTFLSIMTPIGLIIYGCYSILEYIADTIQRLRLDEGEFQKWIEYRRNLLLYIAVPLLRILPILRVELRDIVLKMPPFIWAKTETYSAKKIPHEKVLDIIRVRHKTIPRDKQWEEIKSKLRGILEELGENELLETLNKAQVYLVSPGEDVNSPFIHYDKKTNSYLFTFVTGEPPMGLHTTGRFIRFITRGRIQWLRATPSSEEGKPIIYIGKTFYEQLQAKRPLVVMLLAETLMQLAHTPGDKADIIRKRIEALDKTGITLDEVKTMIKNAYFFREKERSPAKWSKGTIRIWARNMVLNVITWSDRFYNWFHFMKAFMSEFFTITQHWLRTPFIYPLRKNLHCGIPTPDKPIPEYGTYLWAIQSGFSDEAARIIGEADICTDKLTSGYVPRLGVQSRHYNMYLYDRRWKKLRGLVSEDLSQIEKIFPDKENYQYQPQFPTKTDILLVSDERWSEVNYPDTRLDWAQYELERAVYYYRIGEKRLALECMGRGLHSLQDLVAHRDFDVGHYGTRIHLPELDNPDYDPDETGRLVPSTERRRIKETERLTKAYLELAKRRFLEIEEELSKRCYPEHGYFEMTTRGLTRHYYIEGPKKGSVEVLIGTDWIKENSSFTYSKVRFRDGLGARQSSTIAYVARILNALTGIDTTISRVDKYPFPSVSASASNILEELTLNAPHNSDILVMVTGDTSKKFLDRALDIIVNEVLGDELFNDIGIDPKGEPEKEPELYSNALHRKEKLLRLINELALDIKKAQEDKRPFAEEALAQRLTKETYLNLNLAERNGIIDTAGRERLAALIYFFLVRLHEIRGEVSTRPLRPLTIDIPKEAAECLPDYTKEFLEYAVLGGLITDPLCWYQELPTLLGDEFTLSPIKLHSLKIWIQIVDDIRKKHPGLSPLEIRKNVIDCYYKTYGEFATRKLGNVELSLDIIAGGINTFAPLKEKLNSLLLGLTTEDFLNYLTNIVNEQLLATRVVGLGLLTSGVPPHELRELFLGESPVDILGTLGVGETPASLEKTGHFRKANSWRGIEDYIQSLIRTGIKPKRILIDLDMTIFTPMGYLGSNPWFDQRIREAGRYNTFWEWGDHERRMAQNGFFRLVSPQIPEIIERLKAQGIEVIGFTARMGKKDSRRTKKILNRLGIRFSRITFIPGIYHYGGVVFTFGQGVHKVSALLKFTRETTVIIDDTLTNIANILQDRELSQQTYGVLYRGPSLDELLTLKAPDYIQLGDNTLIQGQFDIAQEYYFNAAEQARYLDGEQRFTAFRDIWQRVRRLHISGKDTEELVRFLIKWDSTKHDLMVLDSRLKDPYLNLLAKNQPITDPERQRTIIYEITDLTDLKSLKQTLRVVRDIRVPSGNPKFRIALTSKLSPIQIRRRLKNAGLEEGINYDLWVKDLATLVEEDVITVTETAPHISPAQLIYEGIANAEGYSGPVPPYEKSPLSDDIKSIYLKEGLTSAALYLEEAGPLPLTTPKETSNERALVTSV